MKIPPYNGVRVRFPCRVPPALAGSDLHLGGEVDIAFHGGAAEGRLEGVGTSTGRKQLGESWPDHWSLERDRSYGFTLKLGGNPKILRSPGASLYAMTGIRRLEARFTTRLIGLHGSNAVLIRGRSRLHFRNGQPRPGTAGLDRGNRHGEDAGTTDRAPRRHPRTPGTLAKDGSRRSTR